MKILIILPTLPYPLDSGGNRLVFNMIDQLRLQVDVIILYKKRSAADEKNEGLLSGRWDNVKFYSYQRPKLSKNAFLGENEQLYKICEYVMEKMFRNKDLYRLFRMNKRPRYDNGYIDLVNSIVDSEGVDVVQAEFFENLFLIYSLPKSVLRVFVHHELVFIRNKRFIKDMDFIPSSYLHNHEMLKAEEVAALNHYDHVVTLSEVDKNLLRSEGVEAQITASPAIMACDFEICDEYSFDNTITFIGGSGHSPNRNGMLWFLENVWNLARSRNKELKLNIIGSWDRELAKQFSDKYENVHFLGFVPDLSEAIKNTIMIVPIFVGSGIRIKILEAANYGCPFITTTIGVEGLSFVDGKECIISDTKERFADAISELALDSDKCKRLRIGAKKVLQDNYSAKRIIGERLSLYQRRSP